MLTKADLKAIRAAARELELWAAQVKESHTTPDGAWPDAENAAKGWHDRDLQLAMRLRRIVKQHSVKGTK